MSILRTIYQWIHAFACGLAVSLGFDCDIPKDVVRRRR